MSSIVSQILGMPKEVIFQLLLNMPPDEVRMLCRSQNPKVRDICTSNYFRTEYRKKYGPNAI